MRQVCVICPQAEVWGLVVECLECPHGVAENCRRWRIQKLGWQQTHLCTCLLTSKDTRRKREGPDTLMPTQIHRHTPYQHPAILRSSPRRSGRVAQTSATMHLTPAPSATRPQHRPICIYVYLYVDTCTPMCVCVCLCVSVCVCLSVCLSVCVSIASASRTPTGVQSVETADAGRRRGVPLKAVE